MSLIGSEILAGASGQAGAAGYQIEQSLRFDGSSGYLSRTPGSAGNRKTWTWSGWVKRAKLGTYQAILGGYISATFDFTIGFADTDGLRFYSYNSGLQASLLSNDKFRDPSAWYHIVYAVDTTQGTSSNRVKIYVNNRQVTSFSTATYPGPSVDLSFNTTNTQRIGQTGYPSMYFDGYLAEVNFIDGSALTPSDFGEEDDNGVWRPTQYAGSYTGNSFYLKFDAADVDGDSSGLGNDWTASAGISTSGTGTDVMSDTPTTNWCTLNPAFKNINTGNTYTEGNLVATNGTGGYSFIFNSTIPVSSGKWYAECTMSSYSGTPSPTIGVQDAGNKKDVGNELVGAETGDVGYDLRAGKIYKDGNYNFATGYTTATSGDTIGIKLDLDNNTIEFLKNNTSVGSAVAVATGTGLKVFAGGQGDGGAGIGCTFTWNFGQRAFAYTPPTGYKALNTANLPEPTIKKGSKYFNTVLYTGNGTSQSITGFGFSPDMIWSKSRSNTHWHMVTDQVRGGDKVVWPNDTSAESTRSTHISSFDPDGYTLGADTSSNGSGLNFVSWAWDAGGSGSSNTAGSITSTVSANPTAGFSIVSYSGNGTIGATVGHGLGVAPSMIIIKNRTDSTSSFWCVYHKSAYVSASDPNVLYLNSSQAQSDDTNVWGSSPDFNSTTFELGDYNGSNGSGDALIAYCFAEIEGYSKFGSYTGNGSDDGVFVYCGFKPAWVMVKRTSSTGSWYIGDSTRNTYNVMNARLLANSTDAESSTLGFWDFTSNGFKLRTSSSEYNSSGQTFVFMAFASSPFGGSGVSPATAR